MKVLIVEDEFITAEDIRQILISLGYEVIGIASKYSQAVQTLDEKKADLVLIDIMLGGAKTGIDLAHYINQNLSLPFIYLTSHADASTVKKAKETKPNGYLLKPFSRDDIYTTLEIALSRNKDNNEIRKVFSHLSEREKDVYMALIEGHTDKEIADKLFISLNTTKTHLKNIYKKLKVKNRLEAVTLASRMVQ